MTYEVTPDRYKVGEKISIPPRTISWTPAQYSEDERLLSKEDVEKILETKDEILFFELKTHTDWQNITNTKSQVVGLSRKVYILQTKGSFVGNGRPGKPPTFNYQLTEIDAVTGKTLAFQLTAKNTLEIE